MHLLVRRHPDVTGVKLRPAIVHVHPSTELSGMHLIKTESGRKALQNTDILLKSRIRQILILANGSQSRDSIQDLLERDIGSELYWLIQSGLVEEQVDLRYAVRRLDKQREV
jgi:hypothetical protein